MSHAFYNELWLITRSDMENLLVLDKALQGREPVRKKELILDLILPMYLRYRNMVKRLVICYDQMLQTQKRDLIKRILDCAIGRLLEYRREIVKADCSYYQWPDDLLKQMKFTPDDLEIPVPACRKEDLIQRQRYVQKLIEEIDREALPERSLSQVQEESSEDMGESKTRVTRRRRRRTEEAKTEAPREPDEARAEREMRAAAKKAMEDAIVLIQSHERARVGRCVGTNARSLAEYRRKIEFGEIIPKKITRTMYTNAAVKIQKVWRRYAARKAMRRRIEQKEELLGMTTPRWEPTEIFDRDKATFQTRLELVSIYTAQTENATIDERNRLLQIRGPGLIEDITDEIREWFLLWYNEVGFFEVFPAAKLGGSILIATGQTTSPEEFLATSLAKKSAKDKGGADAEAPKEKKKKDRGKERGWKMPGAKTVHCLEAANEDFIEKWKHRERDEEENPNQKEYLDLITDKLCYELQLEMREIVDEMMRLELERLTEALVKDHANDKHFTAPTMQTDAKKKKPRPEPQPQDEETEEIEAPPPPPAGEKKAEEPIENLFTELVQAKIIRNYPLTNLSDWIGDLSYQNYEAQCEGREYTYRLGEIKQVIMEHCVLPMSSKEVHRIAPLTRAVCICGLPRSGKSFLADAISTEIGALLFDMSPHSLLGKYQGRENERKLIEKIGKVSRTYAPSIIFLDNELPWIKKVPPESTHLKPKRFAKYFPRIVKRIKPGDQILFLTLSTEPYNASGQFVRLHNIFIIIPITDYNTLYMFYKQLLNKYHNVDRNVNVSSLAKYSIGIPLEFIRQAVEKVLALSRRITLKFQPLKQEEILNEILTYEAPSKKVVEQFQKFEEKTPLGRKRKKLLKAREAAEARKERMKQLKKK